MPRPKRHDRLRSCRSRAGDCRRGHSLLIGVPLVALALAGTAWAQEQKKVPKQEPAESAAGTAVPAGAPTVLAPVVVVGEKTERTLQTTATSVSVLTDEEIEARPGLTNLDDVFSRLPNIVGLGDSTRAPTIRGNDATGPAEGRGAFFGGTRPRTTVQLDGRPLSFNELVYGQTGLWDVERIEVLRGPQTTVQGRNSIAGAIIVNTKDPTFEPEVAARAVVGSSDTREVAGAVSGPINEELAYRLSVDQRYTESWADVTGDVGVEDPEQKKSLNVRGKLLFLPIAVPDLSAKLTLNHTATRRPQIEFVEPPFEERQLSGGPGVFPIFENESDSAIVDLDYMLSPALELRNTTTYSHIDFRRLTTPGQGDAEAAIDQFSNELLLDYRAEDLRGILGTYYFSAESDERIDFFGPGQFDDESQSAAIFGEGTRTFAGTWDVTLGARYEQETRERFGVWDSTFFPPLELNLDKTFDAFLPKFGLAYRPNERFTVGATVQRGWNAGGAGVDFTSFESFTYDEEFVWNYETYFRSIWLDGRLNVNGNLFYADYENQQRLAFRDPSNPFDVVIRNAESTVSYGAEFSAVWLVREELEIFASLGLLETEIKKFSASPVDVTGNEFARAPNITASLGMLYRYANGVSVGVDGTYVGEYFSSDTNDPAEKVDAHVLVNAEVAYERPDLRVFAFVTNIFDRDHEILLFGTLPNAQLVDPREIGVGVEVRL